jgi:dTDP-4-amino-4,6-dideoxygalactose transaminase
MTTDKQPFLPFALPEIGEEEIAEVISALRSGWITTGPKVKKFEEEFAGKLRGGVEAIAVNSATAGLHLALEAIGVTSGDEVITTTHTFTATAEVVRYLGAEPRLVDIRRDSYCIDPAAIERAITPRTKAIIPVHYAGLACDMDAIHAIARRHGLRVIEDAAHAFPTHYRGKLVGCLDSDVTVFSFYATKTIATGEGGMLVTRDKAIARRARIMRLHGIDRDAFDRYTASKPSWYYEVVAPGFKYNMTDVAAAIGLQQLRKSDRFQAQREALARRYFTGLAGMPLVLPPRPGPGSTHAWHLYVVRLADGARKSRDEVMQGMFDRGIGCSVHYVPLHLQPYWRDRYGLRPDDFPVSQWLYEQCFSLPIYTRMCESDQDRVVDALMGILA